MKWITQYAAHLMFGLFVILSIAVAAAALPMLVIPALTALAVGAVVIALERFGK